MMRAPSPSSGSADRPRKTTPRRPDARRGLFEDFGTDDVSDCWGYVMPVRRCKADPRF
jgi:hypothetical protein